MTHLLRTLSLSVAVLLAPALARAQDAWTDEPSPSAAPQPPPGEMPPAPPAELPPAPQGDAQPQPQASAPAPAAVPPGQWVYTQQYGWIWMPYADGYTHVPANGYGEPYAYVYYPAYSCWSWVAAPWVWGIGPWPVFGVYGPARFAWYGHGWWRYPSHWHYAPASYAGACYRPAFRSGGWVAPHVAPSRGSVPGVRAPAAAPRAAPFTGGARGGFAAPHAGFAPPRGSGFAPAARSGGFSPPRVASGGHGSGGGHGGAPAVGRSGGGGHGGFSGGHGRGRM
jgi:hypothetical protein